MQVSLGSRCRFWAFCALALVSTATAPSRNPYHMATAWMEPSWLIEHMVMGRRSWMKASTSSGVILIRSRCLTPCPICSVMGSPSSGCTRTVHGTERIGLGSGRREWDSVLARKSDGGHWLPPPSRFGPEAPPQAPAAGEKALGHAGPAPGQAPVGQGPLHRERAIVGGEPTDEGPVLLPGERVGVVVEGDARRPTGEGWGAITEVEGEPGGIRLDPGHRQAQGVPPALAPRHAAPGERGQRV